METRTHVPRRLASLLACAAILLAGLLALPEPAYARDYDIPHVEVDATVTPDGLLRVVETRTFSFDGSFGGVYWDIPTGHNDSNGRNVDVTVLSAGVGTPGDLTPLTESSSGLDGTYEVSARGDVTRLTLYSAHEDEEVAFTISYEATGVVTRWDDTAELYWKFVSDGWDVASDDVTCTLHLPVPTGESLGVGDAVRAWGHGPLDATVSFEGEDVVFRVPGVGTDEFAEMRVTFPTSWVPGLEVTPGERLETILSEESLWAEEANARREQARIALFGTLSAAVVVAAGTAAYALLRRARYRRGSRPRFSDAYFRDVPSSDHPAVLGALHNGGRVEGKELIATLMRLTDQGVIRLERTSGTRAGLFAKRAEDDYRLTLMREPAADAGTSEPDRIDARALDLVFGTVAERGAHEGSALLFSRIGEYAHDHPQSYSDAYDAWKGAVEGAYLERFSGAGDLTRGKGLLAALAVIDAILAVVLAGVLVALGGPVPAVAGTFVLLAAASATCGLCARALRDLNRDAIEVGARLDGLERWLREFTRLEEAVPTDLTLWNRLLIMAVVLDVSKEVVEQLEVALPQLASDAPLMPTYGWLFWHSHGLRSPASALERGVASAHSVSAAALASSSSSSGLGGGGSFSGGGGGGFGGGGGGGAF